MFWIIRKGRFGLKRSFSTLIVLKPHRSELRVVPKPIFSPIYEPFVVDYPTMMFIGDRQPIMFCHFVIDCVLETKKIIFLSSCNLWQWVKVYSTVYQQQSIKIFSYLAFTSFSQLSGWLGWFLKPCNGNTALSLEWARKSWKWKRLPLVQWQCRICWLWSAIAQFCKCMWRAPSSCFDVF